MMLPSLDALAVIDAIDRNGSFARAAAELDRVPSALTYQVRKLEDELDVLLFDRRGHRAVLTPAGRTLLEDGRRLLLAADELQRRVRRVATGWEVELRVALDTIVCLEPLLELAADFYAEEPGTRLRFFTEVLSGTWEALLTGRADLAIGTFANAPGGGPASGFQSRPLGEIDLVFAVAPHPPLAAPTSGGATARWRWATARATCPRSRWASSAARTCSPCPRCATSCRRSSRASGAATCRWGWPSRTSTTGASCRSSSSSRA